MFLYGIHIFLCIASCLILRGTCDTYPKSSLVFVIDNTKSMRPVIDEVKKSADALFNTFTNSLDSPIANFVLVLFRDPNVSDAFVTTDREEFKNILNKNTTILEDACSDISMSGIKTAINASLSGSYVYVFTDSSAIDSDKFVEVKRIAQEKECQVTFVLTPMCDDYTPVRKEYIVYPELAEATSGQVFHMREQYINMILNYTKHYMASRRVTLYVNSSYPAAINGKPHVLDIETDYKMKDLLVSITTRERTDDAGINAKIYRPGGDAVDEPQIVELEETVILSLSTLSKFEPGNYQVVFKSNVPTSIVVTTRSDVTFRHGFSTNLVSSLNNTVFSPFSETKNHLYIKLFGEKVQLTSVKILTPFNDIPLELPLILQDDKQKLYYTKPFDPPSPKFRIVVKGIDTETKTTITRYGSLVVETGLIKGRPPKVNIEGNKRTVKYFGNIELNCSVDVDAYSLPKVFIWMDSDGREWTNLNQSPSSSTYKTVILKNLRASETFECYAENEFGNDSKEVYVEVKPKYIRPRIRNPQKMKIFMYPGDNVDLPCRLLQGKPKPRIKWYFKSQLNIYKTMPYKERRIYRNQDIISIKNVNIYDTGLYKCVANNSYGEDQLTFEVYVQSQPTVRLNIKKEMMVKKNDMVNVKCSVKGFPNPKVSWFKNGATITLTDKIKIYKNNHAIRFKAEEHHSGNYTCQAENELGRAKESVKITVYSLNINYLENTKYELKIGDEIYLSCEKYINATPKLKYQWMFSNFNNPIKPLLPTKEFNGKGAIWIRNGNLKIKAIELDQRGNYTCVASNAAYLEHITFSVDVLFPAQEDKGQNRSYSAVVGDYVLKIFCNIIGNPEPTYIWIKNKQLIPQVYNKITYEKDLLTIYNVSIEDSGYYTCAAKSTGVNKNIEAQTKVNVYEYPYPNSIESITDKFVENGSNSLIECLISHSELDKVTWFKDKKLIHTGKLELLNTKVSDSGVYTCRISSLHSPVVKSANINVIVGFKPKFTNTPSKELEVYVTQNVSLDCSVSAEPRATVTWWYNEDLIESVSDLVYNFTIQNKSKGRFTCRVENYFGNINRTFHVNFKDCVLRIDEYSQHQPFMLTPSGEWPNFVTADGNTTITIFRKLQFSCTTNFINLGKKNLRVTCYGATKFLYKRQVLDYVDIKCTEPIKLKQKHDKIQCQGNKTTTLRLNFEHGRHSKDIFEYCLDKHFNPIYAKYIMRSPAGYIPNSTEMWDGTNLDRYSCNNQQRRFTYFSFDSTKCCFAKRYLVSPRDVFPGPMQRATFNRLNIVPQWSTCHSENWEELEKKLRKLVGSIKNDLIIYTGTAEKLLLKNMKRGKNKPLYLYKRFAVSKYLWKVVQNPATNSSIAIIQLNVPEDAFSDVSPYILCTDICHRISWLREDTWSDIGKGYTYCCSLKDFKDNFDGISDIPFEPHFDLLKA